MTNERQWTFWGILQCRLLAQKFLTLIYNHSQEIYSALEINRAIKLCKLHLCKTALCDDGTPGV